MVNLQTAPWASVHLDDIEPIVEDDGTRWQPIRHELGILAHGVTTWTGAKAGDPIIDDHDEADTRHEELYVVLGGHARFVVDGQELDAPTGTLVFVRDPALQRAAHAVEPATTLLATGGVVGEAFAPSAWEQRDIAKHGR